MGSFIRRSASSRAPAVASMASPDLSVSLKLRVAPMSTPKPTRPAEVSTRFYCINKVGSVMSSRSYAGSADKFLCCLDLASCESGPGSIVKRGPRQTIQ